MLRNWF